MGMNKLFELFEAERPVIPDSNADYYIGYNNGLVMAQAIVLKRDVEEVIRCKVCKHRYTLQSGHSFCREHFPLGKYDDDFCSYGERRTDETKAD